MLPGPRLSRVLGSRFPQQFVDKSMVGLAYSERQDLSFRGAEFCRKLSQLDLSLFLSIGVIIPPRSMRRIFTCQTK
jgi:hypothetical protein